MSRVKRGIISLKKRSSLLKKAKGYRFGRGTKERQAKEAVLHAGVYAFAHRRRKKNDFRRLWQIKINAATRKGEISYSKFMGALKKKNIELNRKVLADIAENNPETFDRIVKEVF